ncbi:MAG: hypothetical protein WCK75_03865 [Elusimicrobiota bacterium]
MQIRKFWLAATLLAVYILPVSAFSKNTPASDELKADTKNIAATFPEPAPEEIDSSATNGLYAAVVTGKAQRVALRLAAGERLDAGHERREIRRLDPKRQII